MEYEWNSRVIIIGIFVAFMIDLIIFTVLGTINHESLTYIVKNRIINLIVCILLFLIFSFFFLLIDLIVPVFDSELFGEVSYSTVFFILILATIVVYLLFSLITAYDTYEGVIF